MIKDALTKLASKQDLTDEEVEAATDEILGGESNPVQSAAFFGAMSAKSHTDGPSAYELSACMHAIREGMEFIDAGEGILSFGTACGTDGDTSWVNVASAIVTAAAGMKTVLHEFDARFSGNGCLACAGALGAQVAGNSEECQEMLEKNGICFLATKNCYPNYRNIKSLVYELGPGSIFGKIDALNGPVRPDHVVLTTDDLDMAFVAPGYLAGLGVKKCTVIVNNDHRCGFSVGGPTEYIVADGEDAEVYEITPEEAGLEPYDAGELNGGDPGSNAYTVRQVLGGRGGADRNAVLMNAGAAFYITGKADSIKAGVEMAAGIIDSGKAGKKLSSLK